MNLMGQIVIEESVSIFEACEKSAACRRNTKLVSRRIKHYEKSQIILDDSDTFEDFLKLKTIVLLHILITT